MICVCIRFSVALLLDDKETPTILNAITHMWFRLWGPPKRIVGDQEGALNSDAARAWATRWQVELKFRPRKSHAHTVERHNELLRNQLHRVEGQFQREGINVPHSCILDECLFAKNSMLSVHGRSPFQALLGRNPNPLREFEPQSETVLDDEGDGVPGISRNINRLREAAIHSMVRGTAQDRMDRAMNSRTRPTAQIQDISIGDFVDFHRDPPNKDMSGWAGPARVVDISRQRENSIGVECQSWNFPCRLEDLRRSIALLCFVVSRHSRDYADMPIKIVADFVNSIEQGVMHFGLVFQAGAWVLTRDSRKYTVIMNALYHVAACDLGIIGTVVIKVGSGVANIDAVAGSDESVIVWWPRGRISSWVWCQVNGTTRISMKELVGQNWLGCCFAQFFIR